MTVYPTVAGLEPVKGENGHHNHEKKTKKKVEGPLKGDLILMTGSDI